MHYHMLGGSGLRVSRLALGTMTFGEEWGWGANEKVSRALFDAYLEAGGNFVDTADMYTNGRSEEMVGAFMRDGGTRDRVVLTTKYTYCRSPGDPNAGGNGRKSMMTAVEGSLKRLATDRIDLLLMHTWDRFTPAEEVLRGFDDLVSSGKILHWGISDVPAWYAARIQALAECGGRALPCALQLEYSLIARDIEHEFVPLGIEAGMGIMAWSPLGGGILTGKYSQSKGGVSGEGRLQAGAGSGNPAFERFSARNFRIAAALGKVAERVGRPPAQVALNWVASRPGVASVIVGATKVEQMKGSLQALDFEIPPRLLARLDEATRPEAPFPHTFFGPVVQGMITGGAEVSGKPPGYWG